LRKSERYGSPEAIIPWRCKPPVALPAPHGCRVQASSTMLCMVAFDHLLRAAPSAASDLTAASRDDHHFRLQRDDDLAET